MTTKTDIAIVCTTPRQIDALVAEHITKLEEGYIALGYPKDCLKRDPGAIPHYTTWPDLDPVIRNREEAGYWWLVKSPFEDGEPYWAGLTPKGVSGWNGKPDFYCHGPTEPIARCIAALASAGINVTYSPEVATV
jgi:hypothetical protein